MRVGGQRLRGLQAGGRREQGGALATSRMWKSSVAKASRMLRPRRAGFMAWPLQVMIIAIVKDLPGLRFPLLNGLVGEDRRRVAGRRRDRACSRLLLPIP